MEYQFKSHALDRMAQRNIYEQDVFYVIQYGQKIRNAGTLLYFLGRRDLPAEDRADQRKAQLVGTNVQVLEKQQLIITVYRNEHGCKDHRKKQKYNRRKLVA